MFSLNVVAPIFQSIVAAHEEEVNLRLNTFAVIDGFMDLNSKNLNRTFADARAGHYWTRKGINRANDEAQYGVLAIQHLESKQQIDVGQYTDSYLLHIAFPRTCDGCPENTYPSTFTLDQHIFKLIADITFILFNEFEQYIFVSSPDKVISHIDYAATQSIADEFGRIGNIRFGTIEYQNRSFGIESLRIGTIPFEWDSCHAKLNNFDFTKIVDQRISMAVKCDVC